MGDHGAPSIQLGEQVRVDGLGDAADLVDLQQQAVAGLLLHRRRDALRVCHLHHTLTTLPTF